MKISQTILRADGFSGINPDYEKSLLLTKGTTYLGCEEINNFPMEGMKNLIPTYISICPVCDNKQKWRTTGVIPDYISCDKCKSHFRQ